MSARTPSRVRLAPIAGRARTGAAALWLAVLVVGAAEVRAEPPGHEEERMAVDRCVPSSWVERLWPDRDTVRFQPTSLEERAAFSQLVPALLAAAPHTSVVPRELVPLAEAVGFRLEVWESGSHRIWVLREASGRHRGAGAYLIRTGPATRDVVQAPHAYFDRGTEELALALFLCAPSDHRPRAFATNTAHRYRSRDGERRSDGGDHPADVAHNPDHLFQLVTELLARGLPGMRLFQLHGFSERTERPALEAVVSAGSRTPTGCVRSVARRLTPLLGEGVRLYPEDTRELGGTRNAQARLIQAHPGARFVHLELSPQARRRFSAPDRVAHLAAALFVPDED